MRIKVTAKKTTKRRTTSPAAKPTASRIAKPAARVAKPAPVRVAKPATLPLPTRMEIASRAYDLYAKSGHQPGREVEFWLEAERQLHREPRR
jgi:hypothetical protein